jgi:hypothetical protein
MSTKPAVKVNIDLMRKAIPQHLGALGDTQPFSLAVVYSRKVSPPQLRGPTTPSKTQHFSKEAIHMGLWSREGLSVSG